MFLGKGFSYRVHGWYAAMLNAETLYMDLIGNGAAPQEARSAFSK